MNGRYRATIIGAIVALSLFGAAGIIVVLVVGPDARSTPVMVTLIGFLTPTILTLLNLLRTDRVEAHVQQVHETTASIAEDLDGRLETIEAAALKAAGEAPPEHGPGK